jgi:bifunctional pyridoxal-dependent enzyme with beta-cystathionase and maltose regulon repressor activities
VNLGQAFEQSLSRSTEAKLSLNGDKDNSMNASNSSRIMGALMEKKIFLASGEAFGSDEPGWFRIVFAHPRDYLSLGLERMLEAITQ